MIYYKLTRAEIDEIVKFGCVYHGQSLDGYNNFYMIKGRDVCEVSGAVYLKLIEKGWKGKFFFKHEASKIFRQVYSISSGRLRMGKVRLGLKFVGIESNAPIHLYSNAA